MNKAIDFLQIETSSQNPKLSESLKHFPPLCKNSFFTWLNSRECGSRNFTRSRGKLDSMEKPYKSLVEREREREREREKRRKREEANEKKLLKRKTYTRTCTCTHAATIYR